MFRNLWIFLREIVWLAVLAVACVLAGIVLTVLGNYPLGLVFALSGVAFATLARPSA